MSALAASSHLKPVELQAEEGCPRCRWRAAVLLPLLVVVLSRFCDVREQSFADFLLQKAEIGTSVSIRLLMRHYWVNSPRDFVVKIAHKLTWVLKRFNRVCECLLSAPNDGDLPHSSVVLKQLGTITPKRARGRGRPELSMDQTIQQSQRIFLALFLLKRAHICTPETACPR